jgi:pyruvate/2-oxoglutarate dehydrogenase complex dihydrolipoamide acyltransferase (E2) component
METFEVRIASFFDRIIDEVRVTRWLVKSGETVAEGKMIVEVLSGNSHFGLCAMAAGRIELLAEVDKVVAVGDSGDVIALIHVA